MPHTDSLLARPPGFSCTASHGGLDAAWVNVVGELDITTAPELERTLRESQLLAHLTVLDLRELTFMDSAGVHTIIDASLRARQDGCRLVLVRGRPDIYRMFTLTGSCGDVDIGDLNPCSHHAATQSSDRSSRKVCSEPAGRLAIAGPLTENEAFGNRQVQTDTTPAQGRSVVRAASAGSSVAAQLPSRFSASSEREPGSAA